MTPDSAKFRELVRDSVDATDLAEEFHFYAEDYVTWEPRTEFFASIRRMPVLMRRLYLVLHMDTAVAGDGFPGFIDEFEDKTLLPEVSEGLRMLDREDIANIFQEAMSYLSASGSSDASIITMDEETDDIHARYFKTHIGLEAQIGKFIKAHGESVIKNES